jgi:hypothetical protein
MNKMQKHVLPGAALMSLVSGIANAAPVPIGTFTETASTSNPAPPGSTGLGPLGAVGGINGPITFNAPFAGDVVMTVQPAVEAFAGDVYQAFINGVSRGFTKAVPLFGSNFTSGTFTAAVAAGTNNFNINDQLLSYIGFTPPYGSADPDITTVPAGFSPNSVSITLDELPAPVPEPPSLWALLVGLLGLAFIRTRRRRAAVCAINSRSNKSTPASI